MELACSLGLFCSLISTQFHGYVVSLGQIDSCKEKIVQKTEELEALAEADSKAKARERPNPYTYIQIIDQYSQTTSLSQPSQQRVFNTCSITSLLYILV